MIAAGKVSKLAEGVPSLKLNLKRKFRENKDITNLTYEMFIGSCLECCI